MGKPPCLPNPIHLQGLGICHVLAMPPGLLLCFLRKVRGLGAPEVHIIIVMCLRSLTGGNIDPRPSAKCAVSLARDDARAAR